MATFVLIPGACGGAWAWDRIVPALRTAGHTAMPLTLTGLGDRVHMARPHVDLETHITDVVNTIHYAGLTKVILVGHSYGGMLLPAVAERCTDVVRLISVDGLAPEHGESVMDIRPEFYGWMASAGGWLSASVDEAGARLLDPDLNEADVTWIAAMATPQPMATFQQRLHLAQASRSIPMSYLLCQRGWLDEPYTVDVVRVMEEPGWEVVELDAHHVVTISQPDLVIEALLARAA